jgi:hypothetical protein
MKRLIRATLIAGVAAALHTIMVHNAVDRVLEHGDVVGGFGGQTVVTYELTLVAVAILFEPLSRGFDHVTERLLHRWSPPSDLLEEALEDLREARSRLERAIIRAERLAGIGMSHARSDGTRPTREQRAVAGARWRRRHRSEAEIQALIEDIRREQREADALIDRIASEVKRLNL